jgi:hypothetical protein
MEAFADWRCLIVGVGEVTFLGSVGSHPKPVLNQF